ncbi:NAD(P)-binding protein [Echria macrotheca]|uniref:NAD(P)-binding protein n=1 Tax=Echria macrotheca TaxID=438768 RepID=A0AAJ0F6D8_9PEZI|nr:NAD(P)-binding protein [Echria macrotheca]
MSSSSVLIVGAGELGTAVISALLNHPQRDGGRIGVLRRAETIESTDPAKQAENTRLTSLGVQLEGGDFVSSPVTALASVFQKYDVVIQCGGFGLPAGTQLRVTDAVLQARVKRYFPWQFGLDYPAIGEGSKQELFDEMLQVRRRLADQNQTAWTIMSTGLFMSFLFLPEFGVVDLENRVVRALGSWENQVTVTTPENIGTMVSEAVYVPEDTLNRVIYVAGETTSYQNLADTLESCYSGEFQKELWDLETLSLQLERKPEDGMIKYRNVFGAGLGTAWDEKKTLNYERGIHLTKLQAYINQHLQSHRD